MNRFMVPIIAVALLLALAGVAGANYVQGSQGSVAQTVPQVAPEVDDGFMFPGMEGIPRDQMFDHFLGGQFTMTDANGAQFTIHMIPGTVSSISNTSITITPNGQTATQAFNVMPNTIIHGMPGMGSLQAIAQGDKVIVMTRDMSQDAIMIAKHGPMMHRRMMESMMMD